MFEEIIGRNKVEPIEQEKPDLAAVAAQAYLTEEGRKKIWKCLLGKKEEETGK